MMRMNLFIYARKSKPYLYISHLFFFFFFQAEDGIRDVAVTGVQTCALPISTGGKLCRNTPTGPNLMNNATSAASRTSGAKPLSHSGTPARAGMSVRGAFRSEERRVGKECRSRWWP